jgi:hypothetical protein
MFEERVAVLKRYLASIGREYGDDQFTEGYNEYEVVVNDRPFKYGSGPEEIQATADQLRKDLVRIFGTEASVWTSDFLRRQELEYEKLSPTVTKTAAALREIEARLPEVACKGPGLRHAVSLPFREEMLGDREFTDSGKKFSPPKITAGRRKQLEVLWQEYSTTKTAYEAVRAQLKALKAYSNLEPAIKSTFDWPEQHDNYTARAYQAVVNPLYLIGATEMWNDGKYQDQLRNAIDGRPLNDYRELTRKSDAEYLVLTETETEEMVKQEILGSVWAFNASWLADYVPLAKTVIVKMREAMSEAANEALLALIKDPDQFIADSVAADGRGHFLSDYDGKEVKFEGWFIYCQNRDWDDESE